MSTAGRGAARERAWLRSLLRLRLRLALRDRDRRELRRSRSRLRLRWLRLRLRLRWRLDFLLECCFLSSLFPSCPIVINLLLNIFFFYFL